LHELQALFLKEAAKYQVFPLDNSGFVRLLAPKPKRNRRTDGFHLQRVRMPAFPLAMLPAFWTGLHNHRYLTIPDGGAQGVIATMGGALAATHSS